MIKFLSKPPHEGGLIPGLQYPAAAMPFLGLSLYLLWGCGRATAAILCLMAIAYLFPIQLLIGFGRISKKFKRWKLSPSLTMGTILGLGGGLLLAGAALEPASAQFFLRGEQWLNTSFPGIPPGVLPLIFNIVRALFILYLLFGLLQVINSVRQGEEWKDLAKTPFMVLLVGVLGDMLIGAITGT